MPTPARLLGFAFANADFLFEVDASGTIRFALGATGELAQDSPASLIGQPAGRLFAPEAGEQFAGYVAGLRSGGRAGPYRLKLVGGTDVQVAMFRLAENGENISCTIARTAAATAPHAGTG